MRNSSVFALLFVVIGTFILYSCAKNYENTAIPKIEKNIQKRSNNSLTYYFDTYGQLHNNFLTECKNNFHIPSDTPNDNESKLNAANNFVTNYINSQSDLSADKKQGIINGCINLKQFWKTNDLFSYSFTANATTQNNGLLTTISKMSDEGIIDNWEKTTLENLSLICERIYKKQAQTNELKNFIAEKRLEHENKAYTLEGRYGKISAAALCIADYSSQWWEENSDQAPNSNIELAIVGDIGGFIIGAGWSRGGGGGDWSILWGGIGGALSGSGGGLIRVGVALSSLMAGDTRK